MATQRHLTAGIARPIVVAVGLGALAALTGNQWFVLLAGVAGGLVVASLGVRPRLRGLVALVHGPVRVSVGDQVRHQLLVRNDGSTTSSAVTISVQTPGLSDVRVYVDPIQPGSRRTADLVRRATQRGVANHTRLVAESGAPLGLLHTTLNGAVPGIIVHPAPGPPAVLRTSGGADRERVDPSPGWGLDLAGIREWRAGDDPRRVHWRTSARRSQLVVVERGSDPEPALNILVVGPSAAPDWETLVSVGAATARAGQQAGRAVAVTSWGSTGASHVTAGSPVDLLDWWAALGVVPLPDPEHVVSTRGGHAAAESLLVLASAHVTDGWREQVRRLAATAGLVLTLPEVVS